VSVAKKWDCHDNISEIMSTSPWLLVILADIVTNYAMPRKLPVIVTSLLREENDGISETHIHQEGRALDLSVVGWTQQQISELSQYINSKYSALIGAISAKDGISRACYYHNNGNGWHFHIQVRPIIKGVSVCLSF
jgi:hypothetical protein